MEVNFLRAYPYKDTAQGKTSSEYKGGFLLLLVSLLAASHPHGASSGWLVFKEDLLCATTLFKTSFLRI